MLTSEQIEVLVPVAEDKEHFENKLRENRAPVLELDCDSLDNVLSFCPNRGCYEIQSLKGVCKVWNLLLSGRTSSSGGSEMEISNTVQQVLSSSLLSRVESTYLPRLYYQLLYHNYSSHYSEESKQKIVDSLVDVFKKVFGQDAVRKISETDIEVDFVMNNNLVFENAEQIIEKEIIVEGDLKTLENPSKMYRVQNPNQKESVNFETLDELYQNWKNQPLIDSDFQVNPYRLQKKTILHFTVWAASYSPKPIKLCKESSIELNYEMGEDSLFAMKDEVNLWSGTITHDFKVKYKFKPVKEEGLNRVMENTIYYLLKDRVIPRMNEHSINLNEFYDTNKLNYLKQLEQEDQFYHLTLREPILKQYRDSVLCGKINLLDLLAKKRHFYRKDGYKIPEYLGLLSIDSMNNEQRSHFIRMFVHHIYNSNMDITNVETKPGSALSFMFEETCIEKDSSSVYSHTFCFPSFPSMAIREVDEKYPMIDVIYKGKRSNFQNCCCCSFFHMFKVLFTLWKNPDSFSD